MYPTGRFAVAAVNEGVNGGITVDCITQPPVALRRRCLRLAAVPCGHRLIRNILPQDVSSENAGDMVLSPVVNGDTQATRGISTFDSSS